MIKQLYHGSDHVIETPQFGIGKPYNDYGLGFYCTEALEMAKEWAARPDGDGVANHYELDCDGLNILDLGSSEYCILHWLSVLLENRTFDTSTPLGVEAKEYITSNFAVDYRRSDVMVGYRADDSYFSFAQDFVNGAISVRQLSRAMRLGKLGLQVVLKSERAFGRLRFAGCEAVASAEWYERRVLRDRLARREYLDSERYRRQRGDLFIVQIMDEGVAADDPRLR